VRRSVRGPQIFVSRTHKGFLRRLFELEVPEIHSGTVEIKAIAREAGSRSKVAVSSRQDGLDPVGATVGQRGARVQAVVAELAGEKIDVIPWSDDAGVFVANALSPAQVLSVDIDEEHRIASVTVPERMLSLAIGREGQNARLAARLTGWRIDIRSDVSVAEAKAAADAPAVAEAAVAEGVEAEAPAEDAAAAVKPKRATKAKTAAVADAEGETAPGQTTTEVKPKKAAAKPKAAATKTAAAAKATEATKTTAAKPKSAATKAKATATASETAAKPKRATKKIAEAEAPAAEEVAS
jgi:transcription termination/antitermination protein NusA